jgi:hypothetical protein
MRRVWTGLVLAAALAAGCSQEEGPSVGGSGGEAVPLQEAGPEAPGADDVASAAPLDVPRIAPSVIKTADLEVEVERDGFGDAMDRATDVASRYGGFVVSSTTAGEEARRGSLVVRVPSDRFEEALRDLRGLGEVERERVSGQDVGQEFVDLEARLRNLEAQEAVLLRLFDEAASVVDTIRIQHELSGVQLQVEEIEGRLRYLRDQTSLGTISVALAEEGASAPGAFDRAWERAADGFLSVLAALVVGLGYVLPFAVIGMAGLLVYRRFKPKTAGAPGSAG